MPKSRSRRRSAVASLNSRQGVQLGLLAVLAIAAIVVAFVALHRQPNPATAAPADAPSSAPVETSTPDATEKPAETAVFLGDSYAQGAGATTEAKRWTTLVSVAEGWIEVNVARGGTGYVTAASANAKVACNLAICPDYDDTIPAAVQMSADPGIVLVSGGRNDKTATQKAVSKFFTDLRTAYPHATIYVTSPIYSAQKPPATLVHLRTSVKKAASAVDAHYLDLRDPLEGHPELIVSDKVHPNDAGNAAIAAAVEKALG